MISLIQFSCCMLLILLIAAWNGLVIKWFMTREERYSRRWHALGFIIRAILTGMVYLTSGWQLAAIAAFTSWVPYNIIINLVWGQPIWHLGDKGVDGFIKRILRKFV